MLLRHAIVLTLLLLLAAPPARAECRLALALAMDVSRSVDARDYAIQTEGLALALESPAIEAAFFGPAGDVAIAVYEWSGEDHHQITIGWTMIATPADLPPVIAALRRLTPPKLRLTTALGRGLEFGRNLLETAPPCARRVLDMAGDGRNNAGPTPERIYAMGGWDGITVNGLVIGSHEMNLPEYFRASVIRGPGAFVEYANVHSDFPKAIRRKLLRELTEAISSLDCPSLPGTKGRSCPVFR